MIELNAVIHPDLAWILQETPLAEDQQIVAVPDSHWLQLRVRLQDDEETFRWLLSVGDQCVIHKPTSWRDAIFRRSEALIYRYNDGPTAVKPHSINTTEGY